jgi:ABC-type transporter Mla subunit MlaD
MGEEEIRQLVRAVREHPEAAEELRRVLLSDELLHLPQIVALQGENLARLTDRVDDLTKRMERVETQIAALTAQVETLIDTVAQLVRDQSGMNQLFARFMDSTSQILKRVETRLDRIDERLSRIAGAA